jgi:hypothetical protein
MFFGKKQEKATQWSHNKLHRSEPQEQTTYNKSQQEEDLADLEVKDGKNYPLR